jgi:hypothetical protein
MALSKDSTKRIFEAVTDQVSAGPEIVDAINQAETLAGQSTWSTAANIVATSTSTTTNFAALAVGDKVHAHPRNRRELRHSTPLQPQGLFPVAAVVGDLYQVLRAVPATPSVKNVIRL